MKRRLAIILVGLAFPCLVLAQTAGKKAGANPGTTKAQAPATKAAPEYKKLEMWLGDWTYEGESQATGAGPAGKVNGKASVKAILGGRCVEWRGEEDNPTGKMEWIEIDAYDAITKRFTWNGWASDGTGQTVSYTIDGTNASYSGTMIAGGKQLKMRGTAVFADNRMSFVQKTEVSTDGKTWTPAVEVKATKIKPSTSPN